MKCFTGMSIFDVFGHMTVMIMNGTYKVETGWITIFSR